jgi:ribosomal protein S27AE
MSFNNGFECPKCGPIPIKGVKKKSIAKTQYTVCITCEHVVTPWTRPLNERIGCCGNCGAASFMAAVSKTDIKGVATKGDILRCCKLCQEVYNTDTEKVVRKGKELSEHSKTL